MRILITGICGFAGSTLAQALLDATEPGALTITGIDNLSRAGSWLNRKLLGARGIRIVHGDIRSPSDLEGLGPVDWVLDGAANPSVLAGIDGKASSRQAVEHNLLGTINLLEFCRRHGAGFLLMSTSRVYSIPPLAGLQVEAVDGAFRPHPEQSFAPGLTPQGVTEAFSTQPPVSLYGSTKVASEHLALEYGGAFGFPVWVNRCGVLAGAGQFGRADQGIFSFWLHSWRARRPMRYIGFDGCGHQVRDCLHPRDLVPLLLAQMRAGDPADRPQIVNVSGGTASARSLRQLSGWCEARWGAHEVRSDPHPRPFDLPWVILDHALATRTWNWTPQLSADDILEEIARHAEANPDWLDLSAQ